MREFKEFHNDDNRAWLEVFVTSCFGRVEACFFTNGFLQTSRKMHCWQEWREITRRYGI